MKALIKPVLIAAVVVIVLAQLAAKFTPVRKLIPA